MKKILPIFLFTSFLLGNTKTVAISYFDNTSGLEQYNPLSKGLADMLITDLSNVKSIQIVEREKLESLLKEIDLGEGKFIDPNTAQKLGKGLGARYILTGSYLILDETMRIDARLVDVATGEISMAEEITGGKSIFFELEKQLVNKLITTLNVKLSRSEERNINKVQTESFESFNTYSTGLESYDTNELEAAKLYFEQAIKIDPDYDIIYERLDQVESKIDKFIEQKKKGAIEKAKYIPEKTVYLMEQIRKGENSCEDLLKSIEKLYGFLKKIDNIEGWPYKKESNKLMFKQSYFENIDFEDTNRWGKLGFNVPPQNIVDLASIIEKRLLFSYEIIEYMLGNNYENYCFSNSYKEMIKWIVKKQTICFQLPIFLEYVNARYEQNFNSINYFDQKRYTILSSFLDEYPEELDYKIYTKRMYGDIPVYLELKNIVKRINNPILYDFIREYQLYFDPSHPFSWNIPYIFPEYFDSIHLYTSDHQTVNLPKGIKYLSDFITEVNFHYNTRIKITEEYIGKLRNRNRYQPDTFYIPDEIFELKKLKKITFNPGSPPIISFSSNIKKPKNLEEIDFSHSAERTFKEKLMTIFPDIEIE